MYETKDTIKLKSRKEHRYLQQIQLPSGQHGGVGRYTLPPHTTKRTTTNLKIKNNQNCQNIELYGSPTTKELKKKHSSRQVGGAETGSRAERTHGQGSGWMTR